MERNDGGSATMHREGRRSLLAGVEVRTEDVDEKRGIHIAGMIFRIAAVVIVLLAIYQAYDWLSDPPPGGAGMSVLISESVRMLVFAIVLYGAAELADLMVKNHYEHRASRILLARQTYLMRQMGASGGGVIPIPGNGDRRGVSAKDSIQPDDDDDGTA
jgi:hypothetical protein